MIIVIVPGEKKKISTEKQESDSKLDTIPQKCVILMQKNKNLWKIEEQWNNNDSEFKTVLVLQPTPHRHVTVDSDSSCRTERDGKIHSSLNSLRLEAGG